MKVTSVRISKVESSNKQLLGFANITLDDAIAIHNIKVIENEGKRFLSFPCVGRFDKEENKTTYSDIVHPINQETRTLIETAVFEEFDKEQE